MMKYVVGVSARKIGAIGVWSTHQFTVVAPTLDGAREKGREAAYAAGLEHVSVAFVHLLA